MNHLTPAISSHLCSVAILLSTVLSGAARALEVRVIPSHPRLGDTLVVSIETDTSTATNPTVTLNGTVYPSFAVGTQRFRAFLPTTPLESPGGRTLQVSGDGQVKNLSVEVGNRDFPIQEIWLSEETNAIEGTDYEFDLVEAFRGLETDEQFWNGVFLQPAEGEISTEYGVRRYYNGEWAADYYHRGLDFAAYEGSPVRAAADGRVGLVGRVVDGFELHGNTVGIDHGQGVTTMYLHLSAIEVSEGQMVRAGDIIGRVGATGIATGPHLHWGLYVHGVSVDPMPWLERGFK
jgi:murein DD-endopeptidase MepM/ murein hydrolase activator NlpD